MARLADLLVAFVAFSGTGFAHAEVLIETVTVGNADNAPDTRYETPGYGDVNYVYEIGTFEVTAGQYVEFLNAVAATDTYGLYNPHSDSHPYGCQITRHGTSGGYWYDFSGGTAEAPESTAADWQDRPVNYVSWGDAARFCNWLYNGQPTGEQDLTTTEDGSYYLNGATSDAALMAVVREPDATWVIPSEDEWYKAAYHYNDGVTANYWEYPTESDSAPHSEAPPGTDMFHGSANHYGIDWAIGAPYYRTEVGSYDAKPSDSAYETFDQGGNISEWNETACDAPGRGIRGGSFYFSGTDLTVRSRSCVYPPIEWYTYGFRVANVADAVPIPAVSTWGIIMFALLVWTVGSVTIARRQRVAT